MALSECSINYHRMKIHELEDFGEGVRLGYFVHNPPFATHVFPVSQLKTLLDNYRTTYGAFNRGGREQKPLFSIAKEELIKGLDKIKDDVNAVAKGDPEIINAGGFKAVKTYRSKVHVPDVPEIESLERGMEREILPVCKKASGAVYYSCILSEGAPLDSRVKIVGNKLIIPKDLTTDIQIDESKKRKKSFRSLKHLVTYYAYFFVRNSAGLSSLSEEKHILCVGH